MHQCLSLIVYGIKVAHQWNLGIGTPRGLKNCPEFWGGLNFSGSFPCTELVKGRKYLSLIPGCPYFSGRLKDSFHCTYLNLYVNTLFSHSGSKITTLKAIDNDDDRLTFSLVGDIANSLLQLQEVGPKEANVLLRNALDREVSSCTCR